MTVLANRFVLGTFLLNIKNQYVIIFFMKMESEGILISLRPFGERDAIAQIFTRDYGVLGGMMRGAMVAKKNRPLIGQVGAVTWNARIDSQLGVFHWDAEHNLVAPLLADARKLSLMNSVFDLISTLLPERARYDVLYTQTIKLLNNLNDVTYLKWEIDLLREIGYALDLSHCSGCGRQDNLNFISPKTGRAVCDDCAGPWRARLYKMPLSLNVCFRFLDAACAAQGAKMPISRQMLRE